MKTKISLVMVLALALTLPVTMLLIAKAAGAGGNAAPRRPEGPCDIYAEGNTPCTAAHSTTRAMFASYNGPLYRVMRQSDGKTLDIGVVQPSATDGGGYADAAKQDAFCANTYCWITSIYDQSGHSNNLTQAPRGGTGSQLALGGFDNVPLADWAPITIMGHKVYGVFIAPGMGMRCDDPHGTAVDDQAEGEYWVVNGHHYNGGCCYDYGNAEIDSRDDDAGTMETTYFGSATAWYHGPPPGPWIMTDQENNLVGCVTSNGTKNCDLPIIPWRFVTAFAKGEPHHWTTLGGDSQQGELKVMFDGKRVDRNYDPMRKQGAILLGNGGDNSNGSDGTFYEGAMTKGGTFPSNDTDQKVQANVVAAKYGEQRVSLVPSSAGAFNPPGLQTFAPGSSQATTVTFKNTSGAPVTGVKLSLAVPAGWTSEVAVATETANIPAGPVAPGATVSATFNVTSGPAAFNGDLIANASWTDTTSGQAQSDTMAEKVRNVSPIKINEFAINGTDSFIELYNAGASDVDLSGWTLTEHPAAQPVFSSVKVPAGTRLAAKGFYVFGLANSGLAAPAQKGDTTIYVRSIAGMSVGDSIQIDTGSGMETRKIASLGTAVGASMTLWQPLPDGPVITILPGSTSVPYAGGGRGFGGGAGGLAVEPGQKLGLGYGTTYPAVARDVENYEVVTVKEVGKAGTQSRLTAAANAGATTIRVRDAGDISVGDKIRLDIDSIGHGIETVTVKSVPAAAGGGGGGRGGRGGGGGSLELEAPLKFNHANNLPFSVMGTGIGFQPAAAHQHSSNEPLQPLGTGITLDQPLANEHGINCVVRDEAVKTAGYQGPRPNQWFGGPALGGSGSMVLRDAAGLVADSLNFGGLVDPWAAEGYQGGANSSGCSVQAPGGGRGGRGGGGGGNVSSVGRYPDGADTGSNCRDFVTQTGMALAAGVAAGANNIKVSSVGGFAAGQAITIDTGANRESAVIATVGTAGATTVGTATEAGATVIAVNSTAGFGAGQTITIDSGANLETALVASVPAGGRGGRGGFGGGRGGAGGGSSITISAPLTMAHAAGAQVSGSGITFAAALTKAHSAGAHLGDGGPTPGAANQFARGPR